MGFLLHFVLVSSLWATVTLPEGKYYNCGEAKSVDACIATKWCIWSVLSASCVYDDCLEWVPDDRTTCSNTSEFCVLNYLTDDQDCKTGEVISQIDRFCRTNTSAAKKIPVDECFYQDLKSRFNPNEGGQRVPKCGQLAGGISCANSSQPDNFYCYQTGGSCSEYFKERGSDDIPLDRQGFCNCLGRSNCYLYPYCTLSTSNTCVADPCGFADTSTGVCFGENLGTCAYKQAKKVRNDNSNIENYGICITSKESATHKENNWNECYFGLQSTLTYENDNVKIPKCAKLDERNKCELIPLSDSSGNCKVYPIVANYFVEAEANYCSDGKDGHIPPAPNEGSILRVPTLLAFLLLVFALC